MTYHSAAPAGPNQAEHYMEAQTVPDGQRSVISLDADTETEPDRQHVTEDYEPIASFFDRFAEREDQWLRKTGAYHSLVTAVCRTLIPPGQRVLEIGCGRGDLLAALRPSRGVGVDVSPGMVTAARSRHPELEFACAAGEAIRLEGQFDYIVLSDLVPYVADLHALFSSVAAHCHPRTRVVVSTYSNLWRPLLAVLTFLGLRPRRPIRNWVAPRDLVNLVELAGLEVITQRAEMLVPTRSPLVSRVANGLLARLPGLRIFALTCWLVARPAATPRSEAGVSVIVPCRNESGSIGDLVDRLPEMGSETEIVFVEGGSTDDTRARIEEEIAERTDRSMKLVVQSGTGKWNAVQEGFAAASHDILMILDGDVTIAPEDLSKFHDALVSGRGELVTGNRLVYGMEPGAMRFLNMLGNKFFAGLFGFILGQYVKDTLCGTKVLHRDDYERILARRHEFGTEDPYGDFDLLLGASLVGLKILNIPVRYRARVYGDTNIRRFSEGGTLLKLAAAGYRRMWVRPVEQGARHASNPPDDPTGPIG
jgi:SAM-dependent methyltransferase